MASNNDPSHAADSFPHQQPQDSQGSRQQQLKLNIDQHDVRTEYANAFRTNGTAEEVMLDFGINQVAPPTKNQAQPEINFRISQRVIMNYYSAKRLAIALGQLVRRHEEQFGELELDVNKRVRRGDK